MTAPRVVRRGLVEVRSGRGGAGAGTIWHPQDLNVTTAHVVQHGPMTLTLPDGSSLPARLLAYDSTSDLTALVVEASGLPAVELADSRSLRTGQWVLALGHPRVFVTLLRLGWLSVWEASGLMPQAADANG